MPTTTVYEPQMKWKSKADVESDEADIFAEIETAKHQKRNRIMRWAILAFATILIGILAINLSQTFVPDILPVHEYHPDQHNGQWTNCGTTIDQALARGCIFDMMGNNWVPPLCHDESFAEAATTGNDTFATRFGSQQFQWFKTPGQESPVEDLESYLISIARQGEEVIAYTSESWHIAHCMYWFGVGVKAMDRLNAGERDVWVPRVVKKPGHARHCSKITGQLFTEEAPVKSQVYFGYATCVRLA